MTVVVVLGWDGLDYQVAGDYGLRDAFTPHHREIETFRNSEIGKPHTYELWPSIITGQTPSGHGIHAEDYTEGTVWAHPLLNLAQVASKPIPDAIRWRVGRWLRSHGHSFDFETPAYYSNAGVSTIFDDSQGLPIAIPNYRTQHDSDLDLLYDRGAQLAAFLDVETVDGRTQHRPSVSLSVLDQRLAGEAGQKLGIVGAGIRQDYDLVFAWLGYLDTVGHIAPVVDDADWHREHYAQAAAWTQHIRSRLNPGDNLVVVSDHGLRGGAHTMQPYYGATTRKAIRGVESVLDVRVGIERILEPSDATREPGLDGAAAGEVKDRLSDLGYLS